MDIITQLISENKFSAGLLAGSIFPYLAAGLIPHMAKWVISGTALIIPPIVHGVKRGLVFLLSHPIARPIIVKNKDNIKKLEDAIINSITAIALAVDLAFDETLDEGTKLPDAKPLP